MRRIPIDMLRPGMKVGLSIYNNRGDILVQKDVVLTRFYIERLKKHNVPALYIIDDFLPEMGISDMISEKTRVKAIENVRNTLTRLSNGMSFEAGDENRLKSDIEEIIQQILKNKDMIYDMIDIRCTDESLFGHCVNVAVLSLITGVSMGMGREELRVLGMGAILHDIGKALIPKQILNKPGKLTAAEFEQIKRHSEYGFDILNNKKQRIHHLSKLILKQHHERFNGCGYPEGLKGKDIHMFSQIVGISDMYDAMTTCKAYRDAIPVNKVYKMLASCGGYLFDYDILTNFLRNIAAYPKGSLVVLKSGEIGIVMETRVGFPLLPKIKIIADKSGRPVERCIVEMSKDPSISIVKVLNNNEIEKLKKTIQK